MKTCVIAGALLAAGIVWLAVGCERPSQSSTVPVSSKDKTRTPAATTQPSEQDKAAMRTGASREAQGAAPAGGSTNPHAGLPIPPPRDTAPAGDYAWEAPADWQSQPPRSAMRRAQYVLPRAEGDPADGELIIFDQVTLSGGGGVDDNLARWRSMMTTAEGKPLPADVGTREDFEVNGLKVAMIDVPGRFTPSQMGGGAPPAPIESARMLAAVVDVKGFLVFIRSAGPAATMAKHRDAFKTFVGSFRPK